jgi:hypothetical protein
MDFISVPELFLALGAVAAVFVAVIGLMVLVATELTEEGGWFLPGVLLPLGLLAVGLFLPPPFRLGSQLFAGSIAVFVPWWLALRKGPDCFRAVLGGSALLLGGGAVVAALLAVHFAHFAR